MRGGWVAATKKFPTSLSSGQAQSLVDRQLSVADRTLHGARQPQQLDPLADVRLSEPNERRELMLAVARPVHRLAKGARLLDRVAEAQCEEVPQPVQRVGCIFGSNDDPDERPVLLH